MPAVELSSDVGREKIQTKTQADKIPNFPMLTPVYWQAALTAPNPNTI